MCTMVGAKQDTLFSTLYITGTYCYSINNMIFVEKNYKTFHVSFAKAQQLEVLASMAAHQSFPMAEASKSRIDRRQQKCPLDCAVDFN